MNVSMVRKVSAWCIAAISACWAISGHALVISVDEFTVTRNGSTFFTDSFTDNNEPPSAPNFPSGAAATYNVLGTIPDGSETGGKLTLNSANGVVSANAIELPRIETRVRLNTDISTNLSLGLKSDDTLSMKGVFGATIPSGVLNPQYSIRFNDTAGSGAHQILQLQITFRTATNSAVIRYILQDFDANTIDVIGSAPFNPGIADEVVLLMTKSDAASHDILGSFAYRTAGVDGAFTSLGVGQMFDGEDFVRAEFNVSDGFVPEPASLALLGLGLAGLALSRRKLV